MAYENCLSLPLRRLAVMLADSTHFRALTNPVMASREAALARIYEEGLPPPAEGGVFTEAELDTYRPFAIISHNGNRGFTTDRLGVRGSGFSWQDGGLMLVSIERAVADDDVVAGEPTTASWLDFRNRIGGIIDDLKDLAGSAEYVAFSRLFILLGPYFDHDDDAVSEGVWQRIELGIEWGG